MVLHTGFNDIMWRTHIDDIYFLDSYKMNRFTWIMRFICQKSKGRFTYSLLNNNTHDACMSVYFIRIWKTNQYVSSMRTPLKIFLRTALARRFIVWDLWIYRVGYENLNVVPFRFYHFNCFLFVMMGGTFWLHKLCIYFIDVYYRWKLLMPS